MEMRPLMDLHTHTLASGHAYSTLKENLEEAKKMGLKVLGTSEHARMMPGTAPLIYFQNFKVIPKEVDGVRLVNGIEANIFDEHGSIDVEEPILSKMDYIIASLHTPCIANLGIVKNTAALVGAAENPNVTVIGHPDDDRYPTMVLMGTDSHICYEIGHFEDSMALLRELDFPEEQVINFDVDRLGYVLRKR